MAPEQLGKAQAGAYVMRPFGRLPRLYWPRTGGKFASISVHIHFS